MNLKGKLSPLQNDYLLLIWTQHLVQNVFTLFLDFFFKLRWILNEFFFVWIPSTLSWNFVLSQLIVFQTRCKGQQRSTKWGIYSQNGVGVQIIRDAAVFVVLVCFCWDNCARHSSVFEGCIVHISSVMFCWQWTFWLVHLEPIWIRTKHLKQ